MKKILNILLSAALVSFAASCTKEMEQVVPENDGEFVILTAHVDNGIETRTSLDGVNVVWGTNDVISAFNADGTIKSSTETVIEGNGSIAKFTLPASEDDYIYAVYPAYDGEGVALDDNKKITAIIPSRQEGVAGTFADGVNVQIAKIEDPDDIHFKNVGGLLAVKIVETARSIESIKISSTSTTPMTGTVKAGFDESGVVVTEVIEGENSVEITSGEGLESGKTYYAVVAPGTYEGVTIVFTDEDGNTATYTKKTALEVTRNSNQLIGGFSPDNRWESGQPEVGPNYIWTLASGDLGVTGTPESSVVKGTPELTWLAEYTWGDGADKYFGWDTSSGRGVQIGKGSAANKCTGAVFSTSGYAGNIESIKINFSHASSGGSSASVKVGNVTLTCDGETVVDGTTTANYYVFTAEELVSGNVVITLSNSAAKAIYLKSIEINPDTRIDQVLSFPEASYSVDLSEGTFTSPTLSGANTSVTYSSSNEVIATVDNDGLVTLLSAGSTTITATAAASDQYKEGRASYVLTVTEAPSSIAEVLAAGPAELQNLNNVTVMAAKSGNFIIADNTGVMLMYKKDDPTAVGTVISAYGPVERYNGVLELKPTTITEVPDGTPVSYGTPEEFDETSLTSYKDAPVTKYVTFKGVAPTSGYDVAVGSNTVNVYGDLSAVKGRACILTGYLFGVNATSEKINFLLTGVVIDDTVPYIGVTPDVLTWEADEFGSKNEKTVTVTSNGGFSILSTDFDSENWSYSMSGDGKIAFYPKSENTGTEDRVGTVIIRQPDNSSVYTTVTLTQKAPGASTQLLSFSFTSNPGDWPTASNAGTYDYKLGSVNYSFALGSNVFIGTYSGQSYLMLKYTTSLGLPAIYGYKLTKVVVGNSGNCSTATKVAISSDTSGTVVDGGAALTFSTVSSSYEYVLSGTSANKMYYLYVTNKNCQIVSLELTYEKE